MATFISHSPADTEALGEAWGRSAGPGLIVALSGELGTGKTQLVKGLARGLGITARVHSPTFTLINIYTGGRLTLFHLDLYRIETTAQILEAGLEEYLRSDGVTVIEWAERWAGGENGKAQSSRAVSRIGPRSSSVGTCVRAVQIETISETERRISYDDPGT